MQRLMQGQNISVVVGYASHPPYSLLSWLCEVAANKNIGRVMHYNSYDLFLNCINISQQSPAPGANDKKQVKIQNGGSLRDPLLFISLTELVDGAG